MRRDLLTGCAVSLILVGLLALARGHPFRRGRAADPEPALSIWAVPLPVLLDPDEPPERAPDRPAVRPSLADAVSAPDPGSFVQPLQPPHPPGVAIDRLAIAIPEEDGRPGDGQLVLESSRLDRQPEAAVRTVPFYPEKLKQAGIEGYALVDCVVDPSGHVLRPYAADATNEEFAGAAVKAISQWRFRPGSKDGRPVYSHLRIPVVFRLDPAE